MNAKILIHIFVKLNNEYPDIGTQMDNNLFMAQRWANYNIVANFVGPSWAANVADLLVLVGATLGNVVCSVEKQVKQRQANVAIMSKSTSA